MQEGDDEAESANSYKVLLHYSTWNTYLSSPASVFVLTSSIMSSHSTIIATKTRKIMIQKTKAGTICTSLSLSLLFSTMWRCLNSYTVIYDSCNRSCKLHEDCLCVEVAFHKNRNPWLSWNEEKFNHALQIFVCLPTFTKASHFGYCIV